MREQLLYIDPIKSRKLQEQWRWITGLLLVILAACNNAPSDKEVPNLASAYAELLIAQQQYASSSPASRQHRYDSIAQHFGYSDRTEIDNKFNRLTIEPDILRHFMDSVQKRLERAR